MSAPPKTSASSCSLCPTTSACCWSSWPTGCTTCARSITSSRRQAPPHRQGDDGYLCPAGGADRHVRDHDTRCRRWRSASWSPTPTPRSRAALQQLHDSGGDLVSRIGLGLQLHLADHGLEAEVMGREKHPFSIWKKMAERHISFEQLSDVMAFRVIVDKADDIYRALGLIHQRWPMVPGRYKDYHLDPQAQRLSIAAHLGHPRFARCGSRSRSATGDARPGRTRARRALGL